MVGQPELRPHCGGPLREEQHRVLVRHRCERERELAVQFQGQPPGGEHPQQRGPAQQFPYQLGAGVHEMLEAVDHQEELAPGKMFEECRAGRSAGVIGESQGVDQRMLQQPGIVDGGQLHHPDPVAVPFLHERCDLGGATGLAHSDHGDEPRLVQQLTEIGQFVLPSHESVQFRREIAEGVAGAPGSRGDGKGRWGRCMKHAECW